MNRFTSALFLLLCAGVSPQLGADQSTSQIEKESLSDSFVLQLLPNSLSKNPRLEMSYITEMTDAGRKLTTPTTTAPTYYLAQPGGYRQLGETSPVGDRQPPPDGIQKLMQEALGKAGYLPADTGHPATLVVIFHWGSYPALVSAQGNATVSVALRNHHLLERAVLVGGEKFSRELEQAIVEASSLAQFAQPRTVVYGRQAFASSSLRSASGSTYQPLRSMAETGFGDATGFMNQTFDPINVFLHKSTANQSLFDLAAYGCYYVVASAYDAGAAAQKQKILLWRTKMCAADDGVSLEDAAGPLIKRSPRFLGRETDGAINISRRLYEGRVDLGELKIIGEVETPSTPEPKK